MAKRDEEGPDHCGTGKCRLFVNAPLEPDATYEPDKNQSHYLIHVMRLKLGESVLLFNGVAGEWRAQVSQLGKRGLTLSVVEQTRPHQSLPDIWLLFAPIKRARLDYMVQKAAEMGAGKVMPVMTRRTMVSRVNEDRLRANLVEAAEQCGLVSVPSLEPALKLDAVLDRWAEMAPGRRLIFCDETAQSGAALESLQALKSGGEPLAVLIGPEGGFDPGERARLLKRDDTVVLSLGPRIMRADTAAVAALSVVQLVLGDWQKPSP
ncbi:MAG: 16S rRNA (uracil1498-N3)-methyltransferase [Parvibaculaceae bacterium]|jgi:16S rRNA (uracil1498-N3)-methyltransferase|nr:16S rRNA (uracil(1498)-N(3))-methyltransferase [Parvibaculaceae bacterium]